MTGDCQVPSCQKNNNSLRIHLQMQGQEHKFKRIPATLHEIEDNQPDSHVSFI